jgi:hypothetical protein
MKIIIFITSLLFISTANASWLGDKTPKWIFANKIVYFGIDNPSTQKLCKYYSRNFKFNATTEAGKNMLSILLAAKMANKKIDIWYSPSKKPGTNHKNGCTPEMMAVVSNIGIFE